MTSIVRDDFRIESPLSAYIFRLPELESKLPKNLDSVLQENAGPDHIKVMAEIETCKGRYRRISEHQLTVSKNGSNVLEMLCRKLEEVADDMWNNYDRVDFVRLLPA